jgi:hypothetical protein
MTDQPRLLYLEPDEEITSVVRRLRETDATRVVLVVPGRSRATASAVGLRLLASFAAEAGRDLALVADASTRALAAEAGIAVFATVADVSAGTVSAEAPGPPRAPIHIVRGAGSTSAAAAPAPSAAEALAPAVRSASSDETVLVRLPPPEPKQRPGRVAGRPPRVRAAWIVLAVILVLAVMAGAALLPAATIRIVAATTAIGPLQYPLSVTIAGRESGDLEATQSSTPTGERIELVPGTGVVTFFNYNSVSVAVPPGTRVSVAGGVAFVTDQLLIVPRGRFGGVPSGASVAVTAVEGGEAGNVEAVTIDTIEDNSVRNFLADFPDNPNRLVTNDAATAGGAEVPHTVVEQSDVDALVTLIELELAAQRASRLSAADRVYAAPSAEETPVIPVPDDLVGTEDLETFELTGTLAFDRPYVMRSVAEEAALTAFVADLEAVPAGMSVVPESVTVVIGAATLAADALRIEAAVAATAVAEIDEEAIRQRAAGLTVGEARTELAELGELEIKLWPAWVDHVPGLTMRITVLPVPPEASESPGESPRL